MTEIVAEISGNHGGSLDNAFKLIDEAAEAGADAVKFQCFDPIRLAARRANNREVLALAGDIPLVTLYSRTHTPAHWFSELIVRAKWNGIAWFSSVFDPRDVDFLEMLDCPRYKVSAFEMLDWDIIKAVRETGKPIVLSVRPRPGLTILQATNYNGAIEHLGLSAHAAVLPFPCSPMVEYHLKLDDVDTPDSAFSINAAELRRLVEMVA